MGVYIKEVKVCFNKKLERVDCDGIKSSGSKRRPKMMGTCARWGEFIYPSSAVPPSGEDSAIDDDVVDVSTTTLVGSIIGGVVTVGAAVALLVGCCIYQKSRRCSTYCGCWPMTGDRAGSAVDTRACRS